MTVHPYLVVGGGPTGLGCAVALAAHAPVCLLDRIPVTGGTAGWADPDIVGYTGTARRAGVRLRLGETALRWDGTRLLVAGPGRIEHIPGRHLFFAGGLRPATAANLCLDGDRPAGVIPGTVAEHLLGAGVKLWDTAAVVGEGPWAGVVGHRCHQLGTRVIAVRNPGGDPAGVEEWAAEQYERPARLTVFGRDRVCRLRLHTPAGTLDIRCDAVILAADPRPNRNVEGALCDGAAGVTFLQPTRPHRPADRYQAGRAAARLWLSTNGAR